MFTKLKRKASTALDAPTLETAQMVNATVQTALTLRIHKITYIIFKKDMPVFFAGISF